jgi:hypothetical protein
MKTGFGLAQDQARSLETGQRDSQQDRINDSKHSQDKEQDLVIT